MHSGFYSVRQWQMLQIYLVFLSLLRGLDHFLFTQLALICPGQCQVDHGPDGRLLHDPPFLGHNWRKPRISLRQALQGRRRHQRGLLLGCGRDGRRLGRLPLRFRILDLLLVLKLACGKFVPQIVRLAQNHAISLIFLFIGRWIDQLEPIDP